MSLWCILLAGGQGKRMGTAACPKQFLSLAGKPIIQHSLEVFLEYQAIEGITIVCAEEYRDLFSDHTLHYALPGKERHHSVLSGFQQIPKSIQYICMHDAARPFVTKEMIDLCYDAAQQYGAAAVGVPVKATIKVCDQKQFILHQPERTALWEMQTPQILRRDILERGIRKVEQEQLSVTDDVAYADLLGLTAKVVLGSYRNIKITTVEDLTIAQHLIDNV